MNKLCPLCENIATTYYFGIGVCNNCWEMLTGLKLE